MQRQEQEQKHHLTPTLELQIDEVTKDIPKVFRKICMLSPNSHILSFVIKIYVYTNYL